MARHRGNTKRDHETERFRAEARKTFGQTVRVVDPNAGLSPDPRHERSEADRLATVHDPARPSACRLCGITVSSPCAERDGWKLCPACEVLLPGGLAAVLSVVLAAVIDERDAVEVADRTGLGNPSYFCRHRATDPGKATPWEHVPATSTDVGALLEELRARGLPRPNTYRTGCACCGVATATHWYESPWRLGRNGPRVAACEDCHRTIAGPGGGSEESWRPRLLAAATGMRKAQWGLTYGIKAFWESAPADPSGTAERWQYLGAVREQLRELVIRGYRRQVMLTDHERRRLAMEASIAEAQQPLRSPLADIEVTQPR